MEWRGFEIINTSNEEKLLRLMESKKLSKEDLSLILQTIKFPDIKNFKSAGNIIHCQSKTCAEEILAAVGLSVSQSK